ncbi:T9SS type A sorting domain-containing protein [Flavobacterium sp. CF136]|uniref:T9SS type A sorting domain-containing protein n=1 Tax=Flavobacterium sp. (strain CF136) TaxID=1144313 RepID=UPI000308FA58|nr:T9SS type A sorting domain-containing protein [Flavobacterium sp. CF136]
MMKNYIYFFRNNFKVVFGMLLLLSSAGYSQITKTVGAAGADYATLKLAFDAVNSGTLTGTITLQVIDNTTETASAVLNASGTGSASYTSIQIYPTVTNKTISGNLNGPIIDLNGADNVVIDGRVNQTGTKNLTISNASVSSTAGTSTIRFINDASSNTIKYAYIKGSTLDVTGGIINFSTTTATTGNDSNTIDNNNITNAADVNRPLNSIYSLGTSTKENSANTISNNNIYDFLNKTAASNGVNLSTNSTVWTISGNSFYETTQFNTDGSIGSAYAFTAITVNNAGVNFTVSNNYIGGNSAQATGTWEKSYTGAAGNAVGSNNQFSGIAINVGTSTASSIQGNTVKGFNWINSGNYTTGSFNGLLLSGGALNVGTILGNTIGSPATAESIKYTGVDGMVNGIQINAPSSVGIITVQGNLVANIRLIDYSAFSGIYKTGSSTLVLIQNNTIRTINATGVTAVRLAGIKAESGSGTLLGTGYGIVGNTISGMTNNSISGTPVSGVTGILSQVKANIINNSISNLTTYTVNTDIVDSSVVGIFARSNQDFIIKGNRVWNIKNNNPSLGSSAVQVVGIFCDTSTYSLNEISGNFVSDLSVADASSTAAIILGIKVRLITGTAKHTKLYNNVVSIKGTTSSTIYGITVADSGFTTTTGYLDLYFNTVNITGGASAGANNSYALFSFSSVATGSIKSNIFVNTRSNSGTASGAHYAINLAGATAPTSMDYNNYYVSGTGTVLGRFNGVDQTTLAAWKAATLKDANSLNIDPQFTLAGGTSVLDYKVAASLTGTAVSGITTDYLAKTRSVPTMGAFEGVASNIYWLGTTNNLWNVGSNWSTGVVPTSSNTISINSGTPVLNQDFTVTGDLIVSGTGTLTINSANTLTVSGIADFGGKNVTFKSDATATARFGTFTGILWNADNITVERYIPARRAYRFYSSPVTTSTSIYANLQEGGSSTAGLGTHITGAGGSSNGFDPTGTNNPSMFTFDNATQSWITATNTNNSILTPTIPIRLMVRGDRTISLATNTPTPTNTTLRATGTLFTGTTGVSESAIADNYLFIGNPYQSPVNMKTTVSSATNLKQFYYVWDPTLSTRGAYVARDLTAEINSITSAVDNYLQPGQACFVQASATAATALSFTEANKYTTATNPNVFRFANTQEELSSLRVTLYDKNTLIAQGTAADGLVVLFGADKTNAVDANDAGKLINLDENLATKTSGKLFTIESKALPTLTDEIQLDINTYRSTDYTFVIEGKNIEGVTAKLFDQLNQTYTEIPESASVNYNFSVNAANSASVASDRFKIVFVNKPALNSEVFLYPNPSNGGIINLTFTDNTQESKVSIINMMGQLLYSKKVEAGQTVNLNQSFTPGIYFVKIEQGGKSVVKKLIIK